MQWNDKGFLISINRYNENSVVAEIYTETHGKCSGIIFGASSKKIKNYLQIGNLLHVNYIFKNESRIGYFKIEIIKATTPKFFDNKKKLMCITSAMNLIKVLTVESQKNKKIYYLIENFFNILPDYNWLNKYIFWELELFKLLGYDLDLKNIVKKENINNKIIYFVESSSQKKIIPNFLIDLNYEESDFTILLKGLNLLGDYLEKSILKANNINFPLMRLNFINILK